MESITHLLVIDDEPGIREGCRRVLEPLGFEVAQAESLAEGLGLIEQSSFDLVLIDVMLPDGRGIDLLEPILRNDSDTICIIITGYATVELAVQAIKQGAYDFLAKPFDADVLELTVRQGLEKRRLAFEAKRAQALDSRLKEVEHEKEELARLEQFKTHFMWMMAHELRSPLSAVQSLLRTLLQGIGDPITKDQRNLINRVENRLASLQNLVNDLLALAASKNPELELQIETLDIKALLESVRNDLAPRAAERDISLRFKLPASLPRVESSLDGLKSALSNLFDNAIKYSPSGGIVVVDAYAQRDGVEISITDTGIGIPVELISRLGEEFFRAPNARHSGQPGTGLGLSLVKEILNRLGGHISIESEVNQGTTVRIWIPTEPKEAKSTE
jgi:signal transduction histidine kinase